MKVLFIKLEKNYVTQFAKFLIPHGVEFGLIDSYQNAARLLYKNQYHVTVVDIDYPRVDQNDIKPETFVKMVREHSPMNNNIIIFTSHNDQVLLYRYIISGIFGIMYKASDIFDIAKQFCFILNNISGYAHQRRYVRVKPDMREDAQINIFVPSRGIKFKSYITDLSIKGVAFSTLGKNLPAFIPDTETLENVQIKLGNRIISVNGKLIHKDKMAFILFNNLPRYSQKLLCNYVADKIVDVPVQ